MGDPLWSTCRRGGSGRHRAATEGPRCGCQRATGSTGCARESRALHEIEAAGSRCALPVNGDDDLTGLAIVRPGTLAPRGFTIQALALYIADNIKKRLATLFD